ncbi:MAG TPA: hypothetical protein VM124_00305, partial [Candidatus Limnocylindrales bacterium]|nr:hypothetical protein [Candidatus Limnocylindrales bacterium]
MKELNIWRYCGAMGVVLLWTGIITAMHRAYLGIVDSRPLSYLGVNQHTGKLFSFSLLASSALFIGFAFYVRRAYKTGNRFMAY